MEWKRSRRAIGGLAGLRVWEGSPSGVRVLRLVDPRRPSPDLVCKSQQTSSTSLHRLMGVSLTPCAACLCSPGRHREEDRGNGDIVAGPLRHRLVTRDTATVKLLRLLDFTSWLLTTMVWSSLAGWDLDSPSNCYRIRRRSPVHA